MPLVQAQRRLVPVPIAESLLPVCVGRGQVRLVHAVRRPDRPRRLHAFEMPEVRKLERRARPGGRRGGVQGLAREDGRPLRRRNRHHGAPAVDVASAPAVAAGWLDPPGRAPRRGRRRAGRFAATGRRRRRRVAARQHAGRRGLDARRARRQREDEIRPAAGLEGRAGPARQDHGRRRDRRADDGRAASSRRIVGLAAGEHAAGRRLDAGRRGRQPGGEA